MKLDSISLRNFRSYGNVPTTINFNIPGSILIKGVNGVGKTTILEGIFYALFDKPLSDKIKKIDSLINNINKKNMEVILYFHMGTDEYRIERRRKCKGGNNTTLFKNDVDITPDSSANINDEIVNIIGLTPELFSRIVTFTASQTPFLDLPSRAQLDMMEELFGLTELSEKGEILKSKIKETENHISSQEQSIEHTKKLLEEYETRLSTAQSRVDTWITSQASKINDQEDLTYGLAELMNKAKEDLNTLKRIKNIEEEQTKLGSDIKEIDNEKQRINDKISAREKVQRDHATWITDHDIKISTLLKKISNRVDINFEEQESYFEAITEHETQVKDTNREINALTKDKSVLTAALAKKEQELVHLQDNNCPYCKQQFPDAASAVKKIEIEIADLSAQIDQMDKDVTILTKLMAALAKKISKYNGKLATESVKELRQIKQSYEKDDADLEREQNAVNPYDSALSLQDEISDDYEEQKTILKAKAESLVDQYDDNLVAIDNLKDTLKYKNEEQIIREEERYKKAVEALDKLRDEVNPHLDALNEIKNNKPDPIDMSKINELTIHLDHQKLLLKLLTKKDSFIRALLLNKNLPFLNSRLSLYLNQIGLPHVVQFSSEMVAEIALHGNQIEFGCLSRGQISRISFALALAFRDVVQSTHGRINICLFDEVLDVGLDSSEGVPMAAKLIDNIAKQSGSTFYVITHKGDDLTNIFRKSLEIELVDDFSVVTENYG